MYYVIDKSNKTIFTIETVGTSCLASVENYCRWKAIPFSKVSSSAPKYTKNYKALPRILVLENELNEAGDWDRETRQKSIRELFEKYGRK